MSLYNDSKYNHAYNISQTADGKQMTETDGSKVTLVRRQTENKLQKLTAVRSH